MNWKNLFTPTNNISPADAKDFIRGNKDKDYQLLDVRQPKEYDREHLPGAILIPVKELMGRLDELDHGQTTLVYCATGVRSKAACQILQGNGFVDARNIRGGIKAWQGARASGTIDDGMEFFTAAEYSDIFTMAYAMEEGLKQLYLGLVDMVAGADEKELLAKMAAFEDRHKAGLVNGFLAEGDEVPAPDDLPDVMEGGMKRQQIMDHFGPYLHDMEDILNLCLLLETQAYDLYSRLARQQDDPQKHKLFSHLAQEEKVHMGYLTGKLDQLLAQS